MRAFGKTVYRRVEWLELRLDAERPAIDARIPVEGVFLGEGCLEEIAAFRPDLGRAVVRGRFARGDRCFGSRHDGRLVSVTWISTRIARIDYLGLAVRLPPRTAYDYDRWTAPALRGLRIAPAAVSQLSLALAAEGFEILTAVVLRENGAGLANVQRIGFRPVATIGWVGVGPLRRRFRRPAEPRGRQA